MDSKVENEKGHESPHDTKTTMVEEGRDWDPVELPCRSPVPEVNKAETIETECDLPTYVV